MHLPLRRFPARGGLQLFALLCAIMAGTQNLRAATITVTTTADSGPGSLRAAIAAASNGDTINFDAALNGQSIVVTSGALSIDKNITIDGPGANLLAVTKSLGGSYFNIFDVQRAGIVTIRGLTIDCNVTFGAGVYNVSSGVFIDGCVVQGCHGNSGIFSICLSHFDPDAYLEVRNSIVRYNHALGGGGGISNLFFPGSGGHAILTVINSVVSNNTSSSYGASGGGIHNTGEASITHSIVTNNVSGGDGPQVPFGNGGGIWNDFQLFIDHSTISGNSAGVGGGGVYNTGFLASIDSSTVSGNTARGINDLEGWGEGAGLNNGGSITITNSTLSNNNSTRSGGAVSNRNSLTVRHSTLSGNNAFKGGTIANYTGATLQIGNTALKVSTFSPSISNISGTITSNGYNLINDSGGGFFTATGDQTNTEPMLGPLQDNGGPTFTHELLTGSPAVDAGNPSFTPPPANDQRGPLYQRVSNGRIDIGSVELQPAPPTPTPTGTPSPTPTATVPTSTPTPTPFFVRLLWEGFDAVSAPPALPPGWVSSTAAGSGNCTPTVTCASATKWVTRAGFSQTASNAAFHDDPGCVTDSNLDTPSLFVPMTAFPVIMSFWHHYNVEEGGDGGVVEISIDGGPFTDIEAAGGNADYNGTISTGFLSPIAGRQAWTGSVSGLVNSLVSLPLAAGGHNVVLRFRLATDCTGPNGVGWYIDSISIFYYVSDASPTPTATATATATPTATPPPATPTPTPTPPTGTPTPTPTPPPPPAQALNLSTRMNVQTGANVGIGGFIITGSTAKRLVLRAIGPSLAQFGIPNFLADPVLELHGPAGFPTIINDNWRDTQDPLPIIKAGLAPTDDRESAMLVNINPGAYTAIVKGKNNTTGVALVEVYDLNPEVNSRLANLSTRAFVGTATDIVIAGVLLGGNSNYDQIVVRGLGPSLSGLGVPNALADPKLELRDENATLLITNDNWQDSATQQCASIMSAAGLAPSNNLESGVCATLPPGAYTALLSGVNNGTGVGLVEVYDRVGQP